MTVEIGDRTGVILHTPCHSNDSICIYCEEEKILFSGDTPLNIKTPGGSYAPEFINMLEKLAGLEIKMIYSGHDEPLEYNVRETILNTLKNVKQTLKLNTI